MIVIQLTPSDSLGSSKSVGLIQEVLRRKEAPNKERTPASHQEFDSPLLPFALLNIMPFHLGQIMLPGPMDDHMLSNDLLCRNFFTTSFDLERGPTSH
jgi:hypothetical protein